MKAFSVLIIWLLSSTMDLERKMVTSLTLQLIPLINSMRGCAKDKGSYVVVV